MTSRLKKSSESTDAAAIRSAIGAGPNEEVLVTSSPHLRERGYPAPAAPPTDWASLKTLDKKALRELGLRPWGCPEDKYGNEDRSKGCLWVFPGEWYRSIPAGLPIVDIFFHEETFVPNVTDDDIRFGCLSFGIMGPA